MKRIILFLVGCAFATQVLGQDIGPAAVLYKTDGRAWRVFLIENRADQLIVRLEKGRANIEVPVNEVERLEMTDYAAYDASQAQAAFDRAEYDKVIDMLEPAMSPVASFMSFKNNLQKDYVLLVKAYYEAGYASLAAEGAAMLMAAEDTDLQKTAKAYLMLATIAQGDLSEALALWKTVSDGAARLYGKAMMERASGKPEMAIQTVVELIAEHPNDMNWMPSAELLCAELYLEMGMPESAEVVARQVQKFYAGRNVEPEADALRLKIKESMEQSE